MPKPAMNPGHGLSEPMTESRPVDGGGSGIVPDEMKDGLNEPKAFQLLHQGLEVGYHLIRQHWHQKWQSGIDVRIVRRARDGNTEPLEDPTDQDERRPRAPPILTMADPK